jgi:hypothetical protein
MPSALRKFVRGCRHPPPEAGKTDTSLRYTDILFGFVLSQLFVRLQNWSVLENDVRWQLIAGTTLVLGSWVGYRRSLNRTGFEIKFFNLPLFRFLIDQLMLILYFRVAVATQLDGTYALTSLELVASTTRLLVYVFALYVAWDLFGIWMAVASMRDATGKLIPRYPVLEKDHVGKEKLTDKRSSPDWTGLVISVVTFLVLTIVWWFSRRVDSRLILPACISVLILYRFAKEARSSWRLLNTTHST